MATKCTWLFNGGSFDGAGRVYGFSETWYSNLTGVDLVAAMDLVSAKRRLILAKGTTIVGYRIGLDTGRAFVIRKGLPAPSDNFTGNLPVDSALCEVGIQGKSSTKRFFIHDLPDNFVQDGEIVPIWANDIDAAVHAYVQFGFLVRAQNPASSVSPILSIDALGNVVTTLAFPVAINGRVQFLNCRDINNRAIRGQYIVDAIPTDATHFHVAHWGGTVVGASGKVRLTQFVFRNAVELEGRSIIGAASRKVGRPFFQSRGRVPVRR